MPASQPARIRAACGLALILACSGRAMADSSPLPPVDYRVAAAWMLGGPGGWDQLALDPGRKRLFVTRGDHVEVVDTASGKVTARIAGTAGVHGVALAPALKRGFTSNGRANSVSMFDLDSLALLREVRISGRHPDAILYDEEQNHVITANAASSDLSFVDASTLQTVGTAALPGRPEFMAQIAGTIYVNIASDPGRLVAVDAKTLAVRSEWTLTGCLRPTGLAADAAHRRLFSACANQVMAVTDAASGRQVARPGIGAGPDAAAFDADLGLVFSANGEDGTLTVIREESPDAYRVLSSLTTQVSARTMALDPGTHRVYLAAARLGTAPAPTADNPRPRPAAVPGSFSILIAQPK